MSRTKSQKARRLAQANHIRQVAAAQTREDIQRELIENRGFESNRTLENIRKGKQSVIAQRKTSHAAKHSYIVTGDTVSHRIKRNDMPLVRVAVTSRLENKQKSAARLLQLHHKYAKRTGMSKADMLDRFKRCYPSEVFLLNI